MKRTSIIFAAVFALLTAMPADAARKIKVKTPPDPYKTLKDKIDRYFVNYKSDEQRIRSGFHLKTLVVNDSLRTIDISANTNFGEQLFTDEMAETIYQDVQQ